MESKTVNSANSFFRLLRSVSLILTVALLVPFSLLADSQTICVKNKVKIKDSLQFSLKKAIKVVSGQGPCPTGFTALVEASTPPVSIDGIAASGVLTGTFPSPGLADGAVDALALANGVLGTQHFSALPGARAQSLLAQAIPNAATSILTFDTEVFDNGVNFSAPGTTFTVPTDGVYLVTTHVLWTGNAVGYRQLGVVDNALNFLIPSIDTVVGAVPHAQTASGILKLTAGTTLRTAVLQTSGFVLNTLPNAGSGSASMAIYWLGQ